MKKSKADAGQIRRFVDQGLSDREIATKIGWTVGTLRVRCSQLKISLRRSTKIAVPQAVIDQLHQHATLMGVSARELAADLLKEIARDNLYDAVLDRDATEMTCAIHFAQ